MCSVTFYTHRCHHQSDKFVVHCPQRKKEDPRKLCTGEDLVVWNLPKDRLCPECTNRMPGKIPLRRTIRVCEVKVLTEKHTKGVQQRAALRNIAERFESFTFSDVFLPTNDVSSQQIHESVLIQSSGDCSGIQCWPWHGQSGRNLQRWPLRRKSLGKVSLNPKTCFNSRVLEPSIVL